MPKWQIEVVSPYRINQAKEKRLMNATVKVEVTYVMLRFLALCRARLNRKDERKSATGDSLAASRYHTQCVRSE